MKIGWDKIAYSLSLLFVGFAVGTVFFTLRNQARPAPIEIIPPEPTPTSLPTATPAPIRVHMSGEVAMPGVYSLPPDSIVEQGIHAAGGFAGQADTVAINLAQPLHDGMQVYVPALGETSNAQLPAAVPLRSAINIGVGGDSDDGLLNINTASAAELETLPGIGPVTAQDIIDHRNTNGPFLTIEAIMDVRGIGEGKFAQIRDLITIGP